MFFWSRNHQKVCLQIRFRHQYLLILSFFRCCNYVFKWVFHWLWVFVFQKNYLSKLTKTIDCCKDITRTNFLDKYRSVLFFFKFQVLSVWNTSSLLLTKFFLKYWQKSHFWNCCWLIEPAIQLCRYLWILSLLKSRIFNYLTYLNSLISIFTVIPRYTLKTINTVSFVILWISSQLWLLEHQNNKAFTPKRLL